MLPLISLLCCIGYSAVKLTLLRPNGRTLFLSPTRLLSAIPGICRPGLGAVPARAALTIHRDSVTLECCATTTLGRALRADGGDTEVASKDDPGHLCST